MEESSGLSKKNITFSQGSNYFRQRLTLSLLSARPVRITEIRSQSLFQVGVSDYEVSLIHLFDKISNGSRFKISETGTEVSLIPGTLLGGSITHDCHESRPLSYYLEPVLLLAPFCKKPLNLTLRGRVQNDSVGYNSVYKLKHAAFPVLGIFGLEPDLQVKSRSFEQSEIVFTCTVKKQLLTLRNQLNGDAGKVKKIRGAAYGFRIAPQMLNRVITAAKGVFLPLLTDVYITNDHVKQSKSKNPGYGLVLYAETTKNITYAADGFVGRDDRKLEDEMADSIHANPTGSKRKFNLFQEDDQEDNSSSNNFNKKPKTEGTNSKNTTLKISPRAYAKSPEDLGTAVAKNLLHEIATESRVDSVFQWLALALMALGPKDVTSAVMGPLTPFTVQFLRDLKTFFGVTFKVEVHRGDSNLKKLDDDEEEDNDYDEEQDTSKKLYKMSCLGVGYINLNKTAI